MVFFSAGRISVANLTALMSMLAFISSPLVSRSIYSCLACFLPSFIDNMFLKYVCTTSDNESIQYTEIATSF